MKIDGSVSVDIVWNPTSNAFEIVSDQVGCNVPLPSALNEPLNRLINLKSEQGDE